VAYWFNALWWIKDKIRNKIQEYWVSTLIFHGNLSFLCPEFWESIAMAFFVCFLNYLLSFEFVPSKIPVLKLMAMVIVAEVVRPWGLIIAQRLLQKRLHTAVSTFCLVPCEHKQEGTVLEAEDSPHQTNGLTCSYCAVVVWKQPECWFQLPNSDLFKVEAKAGMFVYNRNSPRRLRLTAT
jgi:hypothetical protein